MGRAQGTPRRALPEGEVRFKLERDGKPRSAAEEGLEGAATGKSGLSSGQGQIWVVWDFFYLRVWGLVCF